MGLAAGSLLSDPSKVGPEKSPSSLAALREGKVIAFLQYGQAFDGDTERTVNVSASYEMLIHVFHDDAAYGASSSECRACTDTYRY